jgi:broad specificity phosphatase PhoE
MIPEHIFVRHGESRYNAGLTEDLNSPLTPTGVHQAEATGRFLREHLDHIGSFAGHTSPYLRCLQTAGIIARHTGIKFSVQEDPREVMIEHDRCEVVASHLYPAYDWGSFTGALYLQESAEEFVARIARYVAACNDERLLVVSHGSPITALREIALGRSHVPNLEKYVANCGLTYLRGSETLWVGKTVY